MSKSVHLDILWLVCKVDWEHLQVSAYLLCKTCGRKSSLCCLEKKKSVFFTFNVFCTHTKECKKLSRSNVKKKKKKAHFLSFLFDCRVSAKNKAPSPPGLKKLNSSGFSQWHPGYPHLSMDQKENLIDKELSLTVVLPGGVEKSTVVHGRYTETTVLLFKKKHCSHSVATNSTPWDVWGMKSSHDVLLDPAESDGWSRWMLWF